MASSPKAKRPCTTSDIVMEKDGKYSQHNLIGFQIAERIKPVVLKAACSATEEKAGEVFVYCDYGAADGGAASVLASAVVAEMSSRKKNSSKQIQVLFNDQAQNDFKSVFLEAQERVMAAADGNVDVFFGAIGRNFYSQCTPSNFVSLAVSCVSVHWLNPRTVGQYGDKPFDGPLKLHLVKCHGEVDKLDEDDRLRLAAIDRKAAGDWEQFLLHRAAELAVGGRLVVVQTIGVSPGKGLTVEEEDVRWTSDESFFCLLQAYRNMVEEGIVTEEEEQRVVMPGKLRSPDEQKAPFLDPRSPVVQAGLELESFESVIVPCITKERFLSGAISDSTAYTKELTMTLRSWSYGAFRNSLNDNRADEEKDRILEDLYERAQMLVAERCVDLKMSLPYAEGVLVARKRPAV